MPRLQWAVLRLYLRILAHLRLSASNTSNPLISMYEEADPSSCEKIICLGTRSKDSWYFFTGFVYPLLPLDLMSNKWDSWGRIMRAFTHMISLTRLVSRCGDITVKCTKEMILQSDTPIDDIQVRKCICRVFWELVFNEQADDEKLEPILELVNDISECFTLDTNPDWKERMRLMNDILDIVGGYDIFVRIKEKYSLSTQEALTVFIMEFFVTPALEISETVSNITLHNNTPSHVHEAATDAGYMKDCIYSAASMYPVLQFIFRETPDAGTIQIPAEKMSSSIDDTNVSDYKWLAFGRGPRSCKGRDVAIVLIHNMLTTMSQELGCWPKIGVSAGRKFRPFKTETERIALFNERIQIGKTMVSIDSFLGRQKGERFEVMI